MLLSRASLTAAEVAGRDPGDEVLHQLAVESDGTTAASDGRVLLAVGPVTERPRAFPDFPGEAGAEAEVRASGHAGIPPEVAARALRDMPRGALGLELGYAALTRCEPGRGGVGLTTTNLNRNLTVDGMRSRKRFPEWRGVLAAGRRGEGPGDTRRVCVDRRALVRLLRALDAAAPDPEACVFLEIPPGEAAGLVLRARNAVTGQAVVGLAMSVNTRGAWLPETAWEAGVFGVAPAGGKRTPVRKTT